MGDAYNNLSCEIVILLLRLIHNVKRGERNES